MDFNLFAANLCLKIHQCVSRKFSSSRIGFVFVVNEDEKVDGYKDAGVAFFRMLNYITEEYDITQAFFSMVSVSRPGTFSLPLLWKYFSFFCKSIGHFTLVRFSDLYREVHLSSLRNCLDYHQNKKRREASANLRQPIKLSDI